MTTCTECKAKYNAMLFRVCPQCGDKPWTEKPTTSQPTVFCTNCYGNAYSGHHLDCPDSVRAKKAKGIKLYCEDCDTHFTAYGDKPYLCSNCDSKNCVEPSHCTYCGGNANSGHASACPHPESISFNRITLAEDKLIEESKALPFFLLDDVVWLNKMHIIL